jgi:6,7-dimethyl-8-ribityllumazine synthase
MSGEGAPEVVVDGRGLRVGLTYSRWHEQVMSGLVAGARRGLSEAGVTEVVEVAVPGSFELPVATSRLVANGFDAVVALGVVIRGGTPHFEYVCSATSHALVDLSARSGIPVGFGLLTCDTVEQAIDRAGLPGSREDKGHEAATAAVAAAVALRDLPCPPAPADDPAEYAESR